MIPPTMAYYAKPHMTAALLLEAAATAEPTPEPDPEPAPEITLVCDIETNGLKPTVVHCIAVCCIETGDFLLFADQPGYLPIQAGLDLMMSADWLIFHNGKGYDIPHLERLYPNFSIDPTKLLDTLLLARSYFPQMHGHKLKEWGKRLGVLKGDYADQTDWQKFTPAMAEYCTQDVVVTLALHEAILAEADAVALREAGAPGA